jgi:hypothetical protein
MRPVIAILICTTLIAAIAPGCSASSRSTSSYTANAVMRAYTRAGLGLSNTGSHRFGQERAVYLTLTPVNRVVKNSIFLRGAYFSVLVFRSDRAALTAMTPPVKAQLRASEEPWVVRRNVILVSRTSIPQPATSSFGPDTNATWAAAKRTLAQLP